MWHSCHEGPNSPVQPVHWNWKVNWIHGQVWYEILHVHSEANASVLQMKLTTRDWIWCAMRVPHLSWKNRTCTDKYGSGMDISLRFATWNLEVSGLPCLKHFKTNMSHPHRHLPQISHRGTARPTESAWSRPGAASGASGSYVQCRWQGAPETTIVSKDRKIDEMKDTRPCFVKGYWMLQENDLRARLTKPDTAPVRHRRRRWTSGACVDLRNENVARDSTHFVRLNFHVHHAEHASMLAICKL